MYLWVSTDETRLEERLTHLTRELLFVVRFCGNGHVFQILEGMCKDLWYGLGLVACAECDSGDYVPGVSEECCNEVE